MNLCQESWGVRKALQTIRMPRIETVPQDRHPASSMASIRIRRCPKVWMTAPRTRKSRRLKMTLAASGHETVRSIKVGGLCLGECVKNIHPNRATALFIISPIDDSSRSVKSTEWLLRRFHPSRTAGRSAITGPDQFPRTVEEPKARSMDRPSDYWLNVAQSSLPSLGECFEQIVKIS